jgi:hypothetical protein
MDNDELDRLKRLAQGCVPEGLAAADHVDFCQRLAAVLRAMTLDHDPDRAQSQRGELDRRHIHTHQERRAVTGFLSEATEDIDADTLRALLSFLGQGAPAQ